MGAFLLLPFFLVRFGLLAHLDGTAVSRAAHFAPMRGREQAVYWVYQLSNLAILGCILFSKIQTTSPLLFCGGLVLSGIGLVLLVLSVMAFAAPSENGVNQSGVYHISRNPMYLSYFLYFLGCALLVQSLLLAALVLVFQFSAHWVILAEERWCAQEFGEPYKVVRRYL